MDDLEPLSADPNCYCFVDVETRSTHDVTVHGAFQHTAHGRVTIVAYAIGDGPVKDWCIGSFEPGERLNWSDAPDDLREAVRRVKRGEAWLVAWNAAFEFLAFSRAMDGMPDIRPEWLIDSMVQGCRSHLPADLAGAAKAIGLTQKQTAGKALIRMFADESRTETPQSHPEEWAQFRSYARDDVAAMRDVFRATMPLSRRMWQEYWASERINHRGVPVDLAFVRGAAALAARLMKTANADVVRLTGGVVRTVKQNKALLDWIRVQLQHLPEVDRILTREFDLVEDEDGERVSVPKYSLGREIVESLIAYLEALDDREGLTDQEWSVLQLLEVRLFGASATPAKFQKILDTVDGDGRLKGQYVYGGAAATVRFSSKGVQIHNLSRDTVGERDDELDAIELITEKGADAYDEIKERWGYVGKVLSRLIRPVFTAAAGKMFVYCDLASIEAVVCPWLTADEDAEPLLDAIRANHRDPSLPDMYKVQAGKMLGKAPEDVEKGERQSHGKTIQLACIAEGQLVLTNKGEVPIEKVSLDMLVWDGVKFVSHQGLVDRGLKDVWEYQGLIATLDHIVWTEEAGKTTLGRAAKSGSCLLQSGTGGTPVRTCGRDFGRAPLRWIRLERALCSLPVSELRSRGLDTPGVSTSGEVQRLRAMYASSTDTEVAGSTSDGSEGSLHEPRRSGVETLRRSGDRVSVRECDGSGSMGHGEPWAGPKQRDRPRGQRRALRSGQPALGNSCAAELEQAHECPGAVDVSCGGMALRVQHSSAKTDRGVDPRTDTAASARGCGEQAQGLATYQGKARVYDLLNCGPRNRFTVSGKLVHNCQFLGGKGSLHNMARIYRTHFEDAEAQYYVDLWRSENPWATRFGERIWESVLWCMENPGMPRQAGRVTFMYDDAYLRGTLFMVLPNGDPLTYTGIRWREVETKDKATGEVKVETRLTVRKGRGVVPIWKGELVNNATQATAAALLRGALLTLDGVNQPDVVMHTHDEITVMVDEDKVDAGRDALLAVMLAVPDWAEGLPIAADSTVAEFYTKTAEG